MQIHLLVERKMLPVPAEVKVLHDYGPVDVLFNLPVECVAGNHMIVEGDAAAIANWLEPFDGFWLGKGLPQLQQFEISHVKGHH